MTAPEVDRGPCYVCGHVHEGPCDQWSAVYGGPCNCTADGSPDGQWGDVFTREVPDAG